MMTKLVMVMLNCKIMDDVDEDDDAGDGYDGLLGAEK